MSKAELEYLKQAALALSVAERADLARAIKTSLDAEDQRCSAQPIKAGVDRLGRPYIDLTDPYTAEKFMAQAPRFANIKLA